jgi:hypothetical protein
MAYRHIMTRKNLVVVVGSTTDIEEQYFEKFNFPFRKYKVTIHYFSGHELEEIRLRALCTLISKLENGLISEEEIIEKDNLFHNLVKWFKYKNIPAKEDVLKLILRLVKVSYIKSLPHNYSKLKYLLVSNKPSFSVGL